VGVEVVGARKCDSCADAAGGDRVEELLGVEAALVDELASLRCLSSIAVGEPDMQRGDAEIGKERSEFDSEAASPDEGNSLGFGLRGPGVCERRYRRSGC
jgi:hypothetical protein